MSSLSLRRLAKTLSMPLFAFLAAFSAFFGVFSLLATGGLLLVYLIGDDSLSFVGLLEAGFFRVYIAIFAISLIHGAIWFAIVLIDNIRFDEAGTRRRIDDWLRKLDRGEPKGGDR